MHDKISKILPIYSTILNILAGLSIDVKPCYPVLFQFQLVGCTRQMKKGLIDAFSLYFDFQDDHIRSTKLSAFELRPIVFFSDLFTVVETFN